MKNNKEMEKNVNNKFETKDFFDFIFKKTNNNINK
jgi:hypothetical protein